MGVAPKIKLRKNMSSAEAKQLLENARSKRSQFVSMCPRQRVNAAIAHQATDLIPFDFWASPDAWKKIQAFLNINNHEIILDLLDVDCRIITPCYTGPAPVQLGNDVFVDAFGSYRRYQTTLFGQYKEMVDFPLKNAQRVAEVECYPYLPKAKYWDSAHIEAQIDNVNEKTIYHTRIETCGIFEYAWALIGLDKFLICMAEDNMKIPNAIMEVITELFITTTHQVLTAANGKLDMVYIYDDIGTQKAPMMSVGMWKKYILPWYKIFLETLTAFNVQVMYHSCGSIYPFIPHLIEEMGIHVLNPLQPRAAKMDIQKIKNDFGKRLAFHGAIDTQETLPFGSPLQVQESVKKTCRILGKEGGYICAPAHKIQADVPVENIVAMYSTQRCQ